MKKTTKSAKARTGGKPKMKLPGREVEYCPGDRRIDHHGGLKLSKRGCK